MAPNPDVIVAGAGPAGLTAAWRLHQLGLRVTLHARAFTPSRRLFESIASTDVIEHAFPQLLSHPDAGLFPISSGVSCWAPDAKAMPPLRGIDRTKFDAALLQLVRDAGIRVEPHVESLPVGPVLIDARGRSAAPDRQRLTPWRQLALIGTLAAPRLELGAWTESLPNGWLWALQNGESLQVTVFVDPRASKAEPETAWRKHFNVSRLGALCRHLHLTAPIVSCDATASASRVAVSGNLIRIGDAALSRDPLAAQGLTAAISDGLAAAAAANSWLSEKDGAELARAFFNTRLERAATQHVANLGKAYASAERAESFWTKRSHLAAPPAGANAEVCQLHTTLVRSSSWTFAPGPALAGDKIVRTDLLCSENPALEPVAWLDGKPIRPFLDSATVPRTAASLMFEWLHAGLASAAQAPRILQSLFQRRILCQAPIP